MAPSSASPEPEAATPGVVTDGTATITVVFVGRKSVAGIRPGARLIVEGMVGQYDGRLAMLNPMYELLPQTEHELPPTEH